jgi:hypothetical protein
LKRQKGEGGKGAERVSTHISSILSRLIPFVSGIRNQTKKNIEKQQAPKKK